MIEIKELNKSYPIGNSSLHVLKGIDLKINEGEVEMLNNNSIVIDDEFNLSEQLINSVFEGIVSINFDDTNEVISRITIDLDESINAESYQLSVSDGGISISSADSAGALYALQSLKQIFLISKLEDTPLKFIEVNDSPKFSYRGMLLLSLIHISEPTRPERI